MKISDERKVQRTFLELEEGDIFEFYGYFHMKTDNCYNGEEYEINSVNLGNGSLEMFDDGTLVNVVNYEMKIK